MAHFRRLPLVGLLLLAGGAGASSCRNPFPSPSSPTPLATNLASRAPAADLVIHHATIYTVDPAKPKAEAIAIKGDRIIFVGDEANAMRLRGESTRVIDAGGRALVPGLHDAHGHFTGLGASLQQIDLRDTTSFDQIVEKVRARAATARPGEWIVGRSWDQNHWPDKTWPTHDALDRAAPKNPVFLVRVDGHAAMVNQPALDAAGVTAQTKDPDGGRLIRDTAGRPTGVLVDRAMGLVGRTMPPPSVAQVEEQALLADAEARKFGLTSVHDAGTDAQTVEAYKRLIDAGKLKTRLYVMYRLPLAELQPLLDKGPLLDYAHHRLAVRAIKIVADGALGSRGAALLEPYADEPGTSGLLTTPPEEVYAEALAASKAGFQTCIHAIGDRANRMVMDVFERVQREVLASRDLRMRNEHAQILDAAEIPRFKTLNVIASMQPSHCTSDMPWVPARIGPERTAEGAYVWRKLMDAGARLASGSDFPVEPPNPMLGFYAAVTRQDLHGQPPDGWAPDQRLTREEALASFTINAAFASHAEALTGSLEAGKLADLVLLSQDIMTVPAAAIPTTTVWKTITAGQVVYEGDK
jgi:predicted amidohydrolase YtcJ